MQDKIQQMFELQNKLNIQTSGPNWATTNITTEGREINWNRCIYMEAAEAIDSLNWKHWKDISKPDDLYNLKIELVDIWHFIMSQTIHTTASTTAGVKRAAVIHDEVSSMTVSDNMLMYSLENMIRRATYGDDVTFEFFEAVHATPNFTMDDVYTLYVGKNCLNQFRQNNGYKQGVYTKLWNGEEDNVHMQRIMESNPATTYENLYTELTILYEGLTNG